MYSLFNVLTDQHGAELVPVRCNRQTVKRLVSYFEDLVSESKRSVLVLEGRCLDGDSFEHAASRSARLPPARRPAIARS